MKWIIAIVLVLVGALGLSAVNVDVKDLQVTGIQDVSLDGFVLDAEIILNNPGLPLYVTSIDYEVFDEETLLAQGSIEGGLIPPGDTAFDMTIEGEWLSSVASGLSFALRDEYPVTLVIKPNILGISTTTSQEIDLKSDS